MKKIAYIELDTHAEVAVNFRELLSGSTEFEVDFYFSKRILNSFPVEGTGDIFEVTAKTLLSGLSDKNYDLVIIGTAHRFFSTFKKVQKKYPTAVIVHNLRFAALSKFQLFQKIFRKDVLYRLKLFFQEGLLSAPGLFANAGHLFVLGESLQPDHNRFNVTFLPLFYAKFRSDPENKIFTIVIPGAVSQHRRDYKAALLHFFSLKIPAKLVLLGKADGPELQLIRELDRLKKEHLELTYFTQKVPHDAFEGEMQNADVLWCPIQRETEFFSAKEIYGKTKISGNVADAIKYSKTAIFPTHYPISEFYISADDPDFEALLPSVENKDLENSFSKETVRSQLSAVLCRLFQN